MLTDLEDLGAAGTLVVLEVNMQARPFHLHSLLQTINVEDVLTSQLDARHSLKAARITDRTVTVFILTQGGSLIGTDTIRMETRQTLTLTSEPMAHMATGMSLVTTLLNLFLTELSVTHLREDTVLIFFGLMLLLESFFENRVTTKSTFLGSRVVEVLDTSHSDMVVLSLAFEADTLTAFSALDTPLGHVVGSLSTDLVSMSV